MAGLAGQDAAVPVGSRDRYGVVLIAIIASLFLTPLLLGRRFGDAALVAVDGATLLLIYRVSRVHARVFRILLVAVIATVAGSLVAALSGAELAHTLAVVILVLYVGAGPYVVIRRLLQHERITASTVLGALCVYLLVGEFFSVLYPLISLATHAPFFVQTQSPSYVDYLYFSFVTLATVGYGDFTAAGSLGRVAATTEGLLGQLYLVTVVALIVGNLGRARPRASEGESGGQHEGGQKPREPAR